MKIAFSSAGNTLDAPLESRFGRSPGFLVVDLDTDTTAVIDNRKNLEAEQGAGIQAAELIARSGARTLVTGHCGPKAFRILHAAGIRVFTTTAPTVATALDQFREGKLNEAATADVNEHWG